MAATDGKLLAMKETTATVAVSLTFAAMALSPFAAVARAEPYYSFQSPSENVYCGLGQAQDLSGVMGGWGDRISMRQGGAPEMSCHTDTLKDPGNVRQRNLRHDMYGRRHRSLFPSRAG
jgi:hypothetical protein